MADQWMQMLEAIPPGADVFDYIKSLLTSQMFPEFGKVRLSRNYLSLHNWEASTDEYADLPAVYAPYFMQGYWSVIYFLVALQSLSLLAILLAFYLKIRNKGFRWMIVQDGACTHISPKAWLPLWWGVMMARECTILSSILFLHLFHIQEWQADNFQRCEQF
jgi:hypothetical protein